MYLTKTNFGFDFMCQNKKVKKKKNIKKTKQNKTKKQKTKNIKQKTFLSDFGKNFHVGNAYVHTKPLSHAEGSSVTKPFLVIVQSAIYRDFTMSCLYYFIKILRGWND